MVVENPLKTKTVRELGPVDISSIKDEIINLSQEYWDIYDRIKPNKFGEFDTTKHIVFKFVADFDKEFPDIVEFPVWADWKEKLEPIMEAVTKQYGYAENCFGKVMLARLKQGTEIKMHIDRPLESAYPHKIHIPILTHPKAQFIVGDTSYYLETGQAYEVNNCERHAVINGGDCDRIHLIFTYYDRKMKEYPVEDVEALNQRLKEQIMAAGIY